MSEKCLWQQREGVTWACCRRSACRQDPVQITCSSKLWWGPNNIKLAKEFNPFLIHVYKFTNIYKDELCLSTVWEVLRTGDFHEYCHRNFKSIQRLSTPLSVGLTSALRWLWRRRDQEPCAPWLSWEGEHRFSASDSKLYEFPLHITLSSLIGMNIKCNNKKIFTYADEPWQQLH